MMACFLNPIQLLLDDGDGKSYDRLSSKPENMAIPGASNTLGAENRALIIKSLVV